MGEQTEAGEAVESTMSRHSQARMQQRGISARMIQIALECGVRTWSHGAVCHRVTERSLCGTPFVSESDRLRGLCVVVARDSSSIITVKWDYHFREPGPLRRRNAANWKRVRSSRGAEFEARTQGGMQFAA